MAETEERRFSIMWSKDAAAKKHKRWNDGQGVFLLSTGIFTVKDEEGTRVSSSRLTTAEAYTRLVVGAEFVVPGLSVQIMSEELEDSHIEASVLPAQRPLLMPARPSFRSPSAAASSSDVAPDGKRKALGSLNSPPRETQAKRPFIVPSRGRPKVATAVATCTPSSHRGNVVSQESEESSPPPPPAVKRVGGAFVAPQRTHPVPPPHASTSTSTESNSSYADTNTVSSSSQSSSSNTGGGSSSTGRTFNRSGILSGGGAASQISPDSVVVDAPGDLVLNVGCVGVAPLKLGPSLSRHLKPHQREGVQFLWKMLGGPDGGVILADEMGLGKTLQSLALVVAVLRHCPAARKAVVVTPSSLVENWGAELRKWCGGVLLGRTVVVTKTGKEAAQMVDDFRVGSEKRYSLLIVSYGLYRIHAKIINATAGLGLLVCDEGHRLKATDETATMQALRGCPAPRRLLITGTPVQNNLEEFYVLADFVSPGCLGDITEFRKKYARPIESARDRNTGKATEKIASQCRRELQQIVSKFVLCRKKDVGAAGLTPKTEITVFCRPLPAQVALYQNILESQGKSATLAIARGMPPPTTDVLSMIMCLRRVCNHPTAALEGGEEQEMDESGNTVAGGLSDTAAKLMVLESLLAAVEPTGDRVVIASNFTSSLDVLQAMADRNSWPTIRLDGKIAVNKRQSLVDRFNRPPPPPNQTFVSDEPQPFLFLLSAKAGGVGLNLVGANRIVLYDQDWNPSTDLQTMARVWRFGQKKDVVVYRLITTGTLEETIFQRQLLKGELCNVVDGEKSKKSSKGGGAQKFSIEELRDLFTLKEDTACDTYDKMRGNEAIASATSTWSEYLGHDTIQDSALSTAVTQVPSLSKVISFVHSELRTPGEVKESAKGDDSSSEQSESEEEEDSDFE